MFELLFVKSLYLFNNWKLHKIMFNSLKYMYVFVVKMINPRPFSETHKKECNHFHTSFIKSV